MVARFVYSKPLWTYFHMDYGAALLLAERAAVAFGSPSRSGSLRICCLSESCGQPLSSVWQIHLISATVRRRNQQSHLMCITCTTSRIASSSFSSYFFSSCSSLTLSAALSLTGLCL